MMLLRQLRSDNLEKYITMEATTRKRQLGSDNSDVTTCDPYRLPEATKVLLKSFNGTRTAYDASMELCMYALVTEFCFSIFPVMLSAMKTLS